MGYYATRQPLGEKGDFITAPEISQMFGELLGLWAGVSWMMAGSPSSVNLVELGPGRGTLMADMLHAALRRNDTRGTPALLHFRQACLLLATSAIGHECCP